MTEAARPPPPAGRFGLFDAARAGEPEAAAAPRPRGRLFRKYALLIVGLVGLVLLVSTAIDFWFSFRQIEAASIGIQQEKAHAAARRIEGFIDGIVRQIGWTTSPIWAAGPLSQREFDFVRLLRQVPAITSVNELDSAGREQLRVSRLAMDVVGSGADHSRDPAFVGARAHQVWYGPVFFRKNSEPYMTIAVSSGGSAAGVTAAEVNLKLIWDVITALRIGAGGYAYVVDRDGRLIAHPDISRVLRDTDLAQLPQVRAALAAAGAPSPVTIADNLGGKRVLTAHAAIAPLGWLVFVEVPLGEALAPLAAAAWRTALILVVGLGLASLAALWLARRMVVPIRAIAEGAARIGRGELDRRIAVRSGDEIEALAGQFNHMAGELQKSYADLEKKVEARTHELKEALDQQTATAEVLGVINSSPGDLAPVFDAMLDKALHLCSADYGVLWMRDGDVIRAGAIRGASEEFGDFLLRERVPVDADMLVARAVRERSVVHLRDAKESEPYRRGVPLAVFSADRAGIRTILMVPLSKEDEGLGLLTIYRREVRPFSDKEIALLQNFAAQAVIAMENARLLTETREALEQQTATADVLQVINSSPGDLAPVFQAILEKAHSLCGVAYGLLAVYDGEQFRMMATRGYPEQVLEAVRGPFRGNAYHQQLVNGERYVHISDMLALASEQLDARAKAATVAGMRSILMVPLRKDGRLLGHISASRREVQPFSEKEIALLENFAAQAVIAIENARLLTETREALEQQTATAEVLGVINSSPGDLAPVFDAMLEKATNLCGANFGIMWRYEDGLTRLAATHRVPQAFIDFAHEPFQASPDSGPGHVLRGGGVRPIADITEWQPYLDGDPLPRAIGDLAGARSSVIAPLRKDGTPLGAITIYRQEVRAFSEREIALLENFAAQAVIAMENARLLTETREALEQQTATAEVLQVINSSPGDLAPVFDAILEKAMSLCGIAFGGLQLYENGKFRAVAVRGVAHALAELLREPIEPIPGAPPARLLSGEPFVHIADMAEVAKQLPDDPRAQANAADGSRTILFVPLRKDADLLGYVAGYRKEVRPFTDKQIALLQNFAAQAVIAMENARLLTETREALDQQTATAEVLQVINSSPGDLAPVFDVILKKAHELCGVAHGGLMLREGEIFRAVATHSYSGSFAEQLRQGYRGADNPLTRALIDGERFVHIPDLAQIDHPMFQAAVKSAGVRTGLYVPLRKDDVLLGMISACRREIRPFSDKQIALLQNFAAQAVIAMENARLLTETREALEQQTATAEVLQAINSSPGDLAPVVDAMLEKAAHICHADSGFVFRLQDGLNRMVAAFGVPAEYLEFQARNPIPPGRGTLAGRTALERRVVHIEDAAADPEYTRAEAVQLGRQRTMLGVPLIREDALIGLITFSRSRVEPFTEKQIALVTTFADQTVIAIENARLLNELRERTHDLEESLEYQTATSDVLKVISRSAIDLDAVLDTVVASAVTLCRAEHGVLFRNYGDEYRWAASHGLLPEYDRIERNTRIRPGPGTLIGRVALEGRAVLIPDAWSDPLYAAKDDARTGSVRSMVGVPLIREGAVIGALGLGRGSTEPYSEREIQLVTTFADQAVIAIENARLFNELRERTDELGRSVDELKMLSEVGQAVSSTLDLRAVLSTILARSVGLTGADAGAVFRYGRAERSYRLVEAVGWDEALLRSVRDLPVAEAETAMSEAAARRAPVQLADLAERPSAPLRDVSLAAGFRGVLIVPLVGPERILGALVLQRRAAGEFPPETVRLMQTLASQSVLAIQNARLYREIAEKSEELALASQHKSQFLANMSHELRTPLNAILGYAELLVDGIYGDLPERPKGVLERMQNNGRHLLELINDVLDLAKIEAGQLTLTLEDYSLAEVVRGVVTATEPLAAAKGLKFAALVEDGMPTAHGDARRVSQVLLNLAGNAIKFTDRGEVEIRAATENGQFILTVRDTGPGIAEADQERIFGEFQQIDNTNTRRKGGTGLGLAISRRMVAMQGGAITVESVLGEGSTFRVVLPVHVEEIMEAA